MAVLQQVVAFIILDDYNFAFDIESLVYMDTCIIIVNE